jgi:hypothetical protein
MKHRKPEPFILLASCSYCKISFRDGEARHMLGCYPMEQFCTYYCTEKYLKNDRGLKRAIPLPARAGETMQPRHLNQKV